VADEVEVVVLGAVEQLLQPFGMVGGGDVVEDGYGAEAPCVGVDQRVAVDAEEPAFAVDVQHVLRSADRLAVQGPQQGRLIGADRGAGRVGDRQAGGPLLGAAPHGPHVEAFAKGSIHQYQVAVGVAGGHAGVEAVQQGVEEDALPVLGLAGSLFGDECPARLCAVVHGGELLRQPVARAHVADRAHADDLTVRVTYGEPGIRPQRCRAHRCIRRHSGVRLQVRDDYREAAGEYQPGQGRGDRHLLHPGKTGR
jgi:hypothetical protein